MSAFIIYDEATGAIQRSFTVSHPDELTGIMAANTPTGTSSLAVNDGHPVVTDQRGWQVKDGALAVIVPTDAQRLAAAKAAQLCILSSSYAAAKAANVAYMNTSFLADADSQEMFSHAIIAYTSIGSTPDGFFTVDASYNEVPMTLEQLKGLVTAISSQVWTVFQRWIKVRQLLAAATTVAEVQAVVW